MSIFVPSVLQLWCSLSIREICMQNNHGKCPLRPDSRTTVRHMFRFPIANSEDESSLIFTSAPPSFSNVLVRKVMISCVHQLASNNSCITHVRQVISRAQASTFGFVEMKKWWVAESDYGDQVVTVYQQQQKSWPFCHFKLLRNWKIRKAKQCLLFYWTNSDASPQLCPILPKAARQTSNFYSEMTF